MKYHSLLVIGDLNMDTSNKKKYMTDMTCVKSIKGSSIDVLLPNKVFTTLLLLSLASVIVTK